MKTPMRSVQSGVTLVELLVGLAIGLMTVAVALGALLVSRGVSGTVSDVSQLQQQGGHALRVIGRQLRQAGSLRLNLAINKPAAAASAPQDIQPMDVVAFERGVNVNMLGFDGTSPLRTGYQNYTEAVGTGASARSLLSDCLGKTPSETVIQSDFRLVVPTGALVGELQCAGQDGVAQAVIGNVADFQVRYLQTDDTGVIVRRATAAEAEAAWGRVVAVEVCLDLVGEESLDTAGATYRGCNWQAGQNETAMGNRMHMVFRNVFQLRTQSRDLMGAGASR